MSCLHPLRHLLAAAALLAVTAAGPASARADEANVDAPTTADAALADDAVLGAPAERRHAVYLELLGKAGLWGLGYDYHLTDDLGVGGVASFYVLDGQRVFAASPYLHVRLLGEGRHRWFLHVGPSLVHVATPSPVPEWPGVSSTGLGAEISTGYELRTAVLVRGFVMATAGKGGIAPWAGISVGWAR